MPIVQFSNEQLKARNTYKNGLYSPEGIETDNFYSNLLNFMMGNVTGTRYVAFENKTYPVLATDGGFDVDFGNLIARSITQPFNKDIQDNTMDDVIAQGYSDDGFTGVLTTLDEAIEEKETHYNVESMILPKAGIMAYISTYSLFGGTFWSYEDVGIQKETRTEFVLLEMDGKEYLVSTTPDTITFHSPITLNEFRNAIKVSTEKVTKDTEWGDYITLKDEIMVKIAERIHYIREVADESFSDGSDDVTNAIYREFGNKYWDILVPEHDLRPVTLQKKTDLPVVFSLLMGDAYSRNRMVWDNDLDGEVLESEDPFELDAYTYFCRGVDSTAGSYIGVSIKTLDELVEQNILTPEERDYHNTNFDTLIRQMQAFAVKIGLV